MGKTAFSCIPSSTGFWSFPRPGLAGWHGEWREGASGASAAKPFHKQTPSTERLAAGWEGRLDARQAAKGLIGAPSAPWDAVPLWLPAGKGGRMAVKRQRG